MTDPYELLGVPRSATSEQIRQAYKRLALKAHPDKGGSATQFQTIKEAFELLRDPIKRANFDQGFANGESNVMTNRYVTELMARPDVNGVCSVCRGEKIIREAGSIFWTRKPCPKCGSKK